MVTAIVFICAAVIILGGAVGVIFAKNPVHAALSLIASFFGVAVLFVAQEAHFLALVQVVVYAGAIVVLFLFVLMLLGVDRSEDLRVEPLVGHRALAVLAGLGFFAFVCGGLFLSGPGGSDGSVALTGTSWGRVEAVSSVEGRSVAEGSADEEDESSTDPSMVKSLARDLFTRNLVAFEATALLLTIATIGAVVMVKNQKYETDASVLTVDSQTGGE